MPEDYIVTINYEIPAAESGDEESNLPAVNGKKKITAVPKWLSRINCSCALGLLTTTLYHFRLRRRRSGLSDKEFTDKRSSNKWKWSLAAAFDVLTQACSRCSLLFV